MKISVQLFILLFYSLLVYFTTGAVTNSRIKRDGVMALLGDYNRAEGFGYNYFDPLNNNGKEQTRGSKMSSANEMTPDHEHFYKLAQDFNNNYNKKAANDTIDSKQVFSKYYNNYGRPLFAQRICIPYLGYPGKNASELMMDPYFYESDEQKKKRKIEDEFNALIERLDKDSNTTSIVGNCLINKDKRHMDHGRKVHLAKGLDNCCKKYPSPDKNVNGKERSYEAEKCVEKVLSEEDPKKECTKFDFSSGKPVPVCDEVKN